MFHFRLHFWIHCDTNGCTDFTDSYGFFCPQKSVGIREIREIREIRTSIRITTESDFVIFSFETATAVLHFPEYN
jgi:hypothetical protein